MKTFSFHRSHGGKVPEADTRTYQQMGHQDSMFHFGESKGSTAARSETVGPENRAKVQQQRARRLKDQRTATVCATRSRGSDKRTLANSPRTGNTSEGAKSARSGSRHMTRTPWTAKKLPSHCWTPEGVVDFAGDRCTTIKGSAKRSYMARVWSGQKRASELSQLSRNSRAVHRSRQALKIAVKATGALQPAL